MAPFVAAVVAGILSNVGSSAATPAARRVAELLTRTRRLGEPRDRSRPAPQVLPGRPVLTPPVSWPPVPATRPPDASRMADQLAARARR